MPLGVIAMPDNETLFLLVFSIIVLSVFLGLSSSLFMIAADSNRKPTIQDHSIPADQPHSDWMMVFIVQSASHSLRLLGVYRSVLLAILGVFLVLLLGSFKNLTEMNVAVLLCVVILLGSCSSWLAKLTISKAPNQLLPLVELNAVASIAPVVGVKLLFNRVRALGSRRFLSSDKTDNSNSIKQTADTSEDTTMTVDSLEPKEKRMILGVLDLDSTAVREIMVPRVDLSAADIKSTINEIRDLVITSGHSRILIYDGNIDSIMGTVHVRDLLKIFAEDTSANTLMDLIREPFFIPDSKRIDDLLDEMQASRIHIAIVVDEYGGTAGIVTLEDLLEEIVGEIADEFTNDEPILKMVNKQEALVDARVTLDRINEALSLKILPNGFDTVGGLVYQQLGKMPRTGDIVNCEGLKIKVLSTTDRRIKMLGVSKVV
jgi:CBS domain containing-hemolysin-like protein